ncbi:hypothetical protein L1887_34853 [Cichorium endivia]|nr:hypothetical protein L1887_34853 [Cichorium endivia]
MTSPSLLRDFDPKPACETGRLGVPSTMSTSPDSGGSTVYGPDSLMLSSVSLPKSAIVCSGLLKSQLPKSAVGAEGAINSHLSPPCFDRYVVGLDITGGGVGHPSP